AQSSQERGSRLDFGPGLPPLRRPLAPSRSAPSHPSLRLSTRPPPVPARQYRLSGPARLDNAMPPEQIETFPHPFPQKTRPLAPHTGALPCCVLDARRPCTLLLRPFSVSACFSCQRCSLLSGFPVGSALRSFSRPHRRRYCQPLRTTTSVR